jgi:hypothetical protein
MLGQHQTRQGGLRPVTPTVAPALHVQRMSAEEDYSFQAQFLPQHDFPQELSSFVGRGEQIHAVAAALRTARLVTLTGGGGMGKSRQDPTIDAEWSASTPGLRIGPGSAESGDLADQASDLGPHVRRRRRASDLSAVMQRLSPTFHTSRRKGIRIPSNHSYRVPRS